jgi:hypothetical protein
VLRAREHAPTLFPSSISTFGFKVESIKELGGVLIDARCNVGIFEHIFEFKGTNIYFGHKDKVYVFNKQLIIDVFRVCMEGYVKKQKRQVNKSLVV